jgi:iron(III) transport system ATP-binding protein
VTREPASFVGEAVLLPGMATRDRVSCELGELSLSGPISQGAVDVMLRPEQIRPLCAEDTMPNGAAVYDAVVTEVLFQGQDAGVALQLRSDARTMARARVPGYLCPRPGEQVRLAVDGEVRAYARA